MRDHGGSPSYDWPTGLQYFRLAVYGQGAAAPLVPQSGGTLPGRVAQLGGATPDFPRSCNAASVVAGEVPTRSGVGVYVVAWDQKFTVPWVLYATAEVYGTVGMWAQCGPISSGGASSSINSRKLTVSVFSAGGAATDLSASNAGFAAPDLLVMEITARDSTTGLPIPGGTSPTILGT